VIRGLIVSALLLSGCATGASDEAPAFVLMGDAPYSQPHANLLDDMIDQITLAKPAFVVHLGDITGGKGPCTDAWFEARKMQFARFAAPFVLVVGDNEWTDCHRSGLDPLERLAKVRALFHSRSAALPEFARQSVERPEHTRWRFGSTLFVGLNVPGSNNNLGRTPQMDAESAARMKAVFAWLDEGLRIASAPRFSTMVVMMQANPGFEAARAGHGVPDGYAGLRAALADAARKLEKPLLVAHGDTHRFKHDRPVAGVSNLIRIEVDGWPSLGWVRVQSRQSGDEPFSVTPMLHR
jgi:hypothetical protein